MGDRRAAALAAISLVAAVFVSGCAARTIEPPDTEVAVGGLESGDAIVAGRPGSLIDAEQLASVDPALRERGATVYRIRYVSAMVSSVPDGPTGPAAPDPPTDDGVEVTGVVVVPAGPAPIGGRPIVAVGHGTTGLTDECAPSLYPNLLGSVTPATAAIDMGAVVVATDYRGLGTAAEHPYLDARASARDLIDSVRATRELVPDTAPRWAGLGISQGGQAVWAAAELAEDLAPDLDFVGGAALSPVADLSGWFDPSGQLSLTGPERSLYPLVVTGAAVADAAINPLDYLPELPPETLAGLTGCAGARSLDKFAAFAEFADAEAKPRTPQAAAALQQWLTAGALPLRPGGGPLLVIVAGRDDVIPPDSTIRAAQRACAQGAPLSILLRPDDPHADTAALSDAMTWLTPALAGDGPGPGGVPCGAVPT